MDDAIIISPSFMVIEGLDFEVNLLFERQR